MVLLCLTETCRPRMAGIPGNLEVNIMPDTGTKADPVWMSISGTSTATGQVSKAKLPDRIHSSA